MEINVKRLLSFILFALIISGMTLCVFASGDFSVAITSDKDYASVGETVTLTVSLSGTPSSSSGSISVTVGDALEVVSGEMITAGAAMKSFDTATNKGVAALASAGSFDGDFARITLRVKEGEGRDVSVTVKLNPSGAGQSATYTVAEEPEITAAATVGAAEAASGESVTLDVTLSGAPKIKSLAVSDVSYASSALELTNVEWIVPNTLLSRWDATTGKGVAALENETDVNGAILRLTFNAKSGASEGEYPVSLTVSAKDKSGDPIALTNVPGAVTVTSPVLKGDVNGDGKFTSKDISLLKRVVAGTAAEGAYNELNADVNGDGKFTSKDISALKKIIAQG